MIFFVLIWVPNKKIIFGFFLVGCCCFGSKTNFEILKAVGCSNLDLVFQNIPTQTVSRYVSSTCVPKKGLVLIVRGYPEITLVAKGGLYIIHSTFYDHIQCVQ